MIDLFIEIGQNITQQKEMLGDKYTNIVHLEKYLSISLQVKLLFPDTKRKGKFWYI